MPLHPRSTLGESFPHAPIFEEGARHHMESRGVESRQLLLSAVACSRTGTSFMSHSTCVFSFFGRDGCFLVPYVEVICLKKTAAKLNEVLRLSHATLAICYLGSVACLSVLDLSSRTPFIERRGEHHHELPLWPSHGARRAISGWFE
jgi:hypothetical protein